MSFFDIFKIDKIKEENKRLNIRVSYLEKQLSDLGFTEYEQTKNAIDSMNKEIAEADITISKLKTQIEALNVDAENTEKKLSSSVKKLKRSKEIYFRLNHFNIIQIVRN